jgi:hypothetical protein
MVDRWASRGKRFTPRVARPGGSCYLRRPARPECVRARFLENVMIKSPLAAVKERFQDKAGLLKAVKELATEELWVDRLDSDKGLDSISNRKLLRLHTLLGEVKQQFGTRAKLIGAILTQEKREKDDGYKARLERFSTPRLFDHYRAGKKRAN